MQVYWCSIEYEYDTKESKLKGGFVYAFVKASNQVGAISAIHKKLKSENLAPLSAEFVKPYDPQTKWNDAIQTKHYYELYSSALNSHDVIFDDYYAYEKRD